jgi:hypothetical protein
MCIERFLTIKDRDQSGKATVSRITKDALVPFYQSLFTGLFSVLENMGADSVRDALFLLGVPQFIRLH